MIWIAHRINTVEQLRSVPREFGVEVDLRDRGDRLILQHDPFGDGEDFETWLQAYRHRLIVLNVKSERIEHKVRDLVRQYGISDYFFLDCSFPMMNLLSRQGENHLAARFSELEPVEACLALAGRAEWVWVDCFTHMPLTADTYSLLRKHFQICVVSPELQGRGGESIAGYAAALAPFPVDAVCTKYPALWQRATMAAA